MSQRSPLYALLALTLGPMLLAPVASADEAAAWERLAPAREALARNDYARTREVLFDRLLASDTPDAELVLIGRLGFHLSDRDTLQELRAVLGERNKDGTSATRQIAEGWAFVGLARHYIRAQTNGSTIPMLLGDAGKIAQDLLGGTGEQVLKNAAALLEARVQTVQARSADALKVLAGAGERTAIWAAALNGLEGRLLYDRGAAAALGEDGRPTTAATQDLRRGHDLMASALAAPMQIGTNKEGLESLIARRAWASHRLGDVTKAEPEYHALYDRGPQGRSLALRGLQSLFASDPDRLDQALVDLAGAKQADGDAAWAATIDTRVRRSKLGLALLAAQSYLALGNTPAAFTAHGRVLQAMQAWTEAEQSYASALSLDAEYLPAAAALELMARARLRAEPVRALATYEHLLRLRPNDPYARNNLGFVLRDLVSPHTAMQRGSNLQRLEPDAPAHVHVWLERSVSVYAEAVALIPEEDDGQREVAEDWNLAGIVNDYALMLHYFVDVQDAAKAEALYMRTLRMTEYGFKDTYAPNLQRLYAFVLKDRELRWLRLAKQAQDAIMKEQSDGKGGVALVPDEAKRESARRDHSRIRAHLIKLLGAEESDDSKKGPR